MPLEHLNTHKLELLLSRTYVHGSKIGRDIEVLLYTAAQYHYNR